MTSLVIDLTGYDVWRRGQGEVIDLTGWESQVVDLTQDEEGAGGEYNVLDLPNELLQEICKFLEPLDHVCFGLASKETMGRVLGLLGRPLGDGTFGAFDFSNPFEQQPYERKQLFKKGRYNNTIHSAIGTCVLRKAGWPAVILANALCDLGKGVEIGPIVSDMVRAKAWNVLKLFSREEFFDRYTFCSTVLAQIDDFDAYRFILDNHRIKWTRRGGHSFWSWGTPEQISYILQHPNFTRNEARKRALEYLVEENDPQKRQKAWTVFQSIESQEGVTDMVIASSSDVCS